MEIPLQIIGGRIEKNGGRVRHSCSYPLPGGRLPGERQVLQVDRSDVVIAAVREVVDMARACRNLFTAKTSAWRIYEPF
jgi:hypothetical protein